MLGHAKASMTLDVYADLFDDDLVAGRLDEKFRKADPSPNNPAAYWEQRKLIAPDLADALNWVPWTTNGSPSASPSRVYTVRDRGPGFYCRPLRPTITSLRPVHGGHAMVGTGQWAGSRAAAWAIWCQLTSPTVIGSSYRLR